MESQKSYLNYRDFKYQMAKNQMENRKGRKLTCREGGERQGYKDQKQGGGLVFFTSSWPKAILSFLSSFFNGSDDHS